MLIILFFISNIYSQVNTLWIKTYIGSGTDFSHSVQQTADEGYIIIGSTTSFGTVNGDVWLIKTNSFGDTLWTKTLGGIYQDWVLPIQQTMDEGYIITGLTFTSSTNRYDVWLIKTIPDVNPVKKDISNIPSEYKLAQNFPNPFNPKTTFQYFVPKSDQVTITIYTISGQLSESKTMKLNSGSYIYEFDGFSYSTGIYIYKI